MNERIIPWGTVIAGTIAVATAVIVGLVHIGGWTVPFQTAGPGAVIVVGILIVLAGLFAVLRSSRSTAVPQPARGTVHTPPPTTSADAGPQTGTATVPAAQGPVDDPAAVAVPAHDLSPESQDGDAAQSNH